MKPLDLNLLIFAVNRDSAQHRAARAWLEDVLSGEETVALSWVVILGFLRLTTNPRVVTRPLTTEQALGVADGWLARPAVVALNPADEY